MSGSLVYTPAIGLLQLAVPSYALRLTRALGAQRVGWPLVITFLLLALLQLANPWPLAAAGVDGWVLALSLVIPVLLLIGLGHVEAVGHERLRAERTEKKLREELERQFAGRTAELERLVAGLREKIARGCQLEQLLRESEAQYRFLFLENPLPMWIFDLRSQRFLAVNHTALRQYGYTQEEFMALKPQDLCLPAERSAVAADVLKPCSCPQARGVWRHARKDQSLIEVQLTAVDFMYAGYPSRLVLAQDVTERRKAEQRALQPQKLDQMAQLAGRVADHYQKLLLVLDGYTRLLLQKDAEPATAEQLRRIGATVARAGESTRQLLAVARCRPFNPQPLDLNRFIDLLARKLGVQLPDNIRLDKIFGANLQPVLADPAVLAEIIASLITNAREAMPNGGALTLSTNLVQVDQEYIRFQEEARLGTFACVTICDTGIGMPPQVRARLFEPFLTTKDATQAAGLSLAAAYGLVKQQGGWMEANSEEGVGTILRVFLPCAT